MKKENVVDEYSNNEVPLYKIWGYGVGTVIVFAFAGIVLYHLSSSPLMTFITWSLGITIGVGAPACLIGHFAKQAHEARLKELNASKYSSNSIGMYPVYLDKKAGRFIEPSGNQLLQNVPQNWSPNTHNDVKELYRIIEMVREQAQPQPQIEAPDENFIPEPYSFSSVLQNWQPTKSGILLAKKQELITVPLGEGLCHTTFTGNTDAGKTNNERFLLLQLLFLRQCVYLCDKNYQRYRYDQKMGLYYDYEPIEQLLAHEPITDSKKCLALLKGINTELESRRAQRRHNRVQFKDIYLVMDELPAFCSDEADIMFYVGKLLREARQYGIFFIGAAQDLLNNTLNSDNGAIRANLLTNFYGGGDMTTARHVLSLQKGEKIDESGLGVKGITYLRAKGAGIDKVKARAPYCDELATQMLLGDRVPGTKRSAPIDTDPYQDVIEADVIAPKQSEKREATLSDAIEVWNEYGEMGRPRLQKLLKDSGLECSDYRADKLLQNLKERLERQN